MKYRDFQVLTVDNELCFRSVRIAHARIHAGIRDLGILNDEFSLTSLSLDLYSVNKSIFVRKLFSKEVFEVYLPFIGCDFLLALEPLDIARGIVELAKQRNRFFLYGRLVFENLDEFVRVLDDRKRRVGFVGLLGNFTEVFATVVEGCVSDGQSANARHVFRYLINIAILSSELLF